MEDLWPTDNENLHSEHKLPARMSHSTYSFVRSVAIMRLRIGVRFGSQLKYNQTHFGARVVCVCVLHNAHGFALSDRMNGNAQRNRLLSERARLVAHCFMIFQLASE